MGDSPATALPYEWSTDPDQLGFLSVAEIVDKFRLHVAARTLDHELDAPDGTYFNEGQLNWQVTYVLKGKDLTGTKVTADNDLKPPSSPEALDVNVVPAIIYASFPYTTWD